MLFLSFFPPLLILWFEKIAFTKWHRSAAKKVTVAVRSLVTKLESVSIVFMEPKTAGSLEYFFLIGSFDFHGQLEMLHYWAKGAITIP